MKSNTIKKVLSGAVLAMLPTVVAISSSSSLSASAKSAFLQAEKSGYFRADYDTLSDVEDAAADLNIRLAGQGSVLLKNKNKALPIAKTTKITVLGEQADCYATGGSGSGGQTKPAGDNTPDTPYSIFEALEKEGFEYNASVKDAYAKQENAPKTTLVSKNPYEAGHYMDEVATADVNTVDFGGKHYQSLASDTGTLADVNLTGYTDGVALVVISRTGAEGQDNEAIDVAGAESSTDHYLDLNKGERELIAYAKKNFSKVVLLINSPSAMALSDAEKDDGVNGILWIGQTGWNGILAMPQILDGKINPSGRTVDIYEADERTDPTWYNFGNYEQSNYIINGQKDSGTVTSKDAVKLGYDAAYATDGVTDGGYKTIDYAEGIYMGYRYYETVYAELLAKKGQQVADAWYAKDVVYPFGYGLSYTSFEQKIVSISKSSVQKDDQITVKTSVKNTGSVAGADVVQLYSSSPYVEGGIEKAAATLVGFTKTGIIDAGATSEVEVTIDAKDLASFDYNDANNNNNYGYELEAGSIALSIRNNSHDVLDSKDVTVASLQTWDEDNDPNTPNNIFSQTSGKWEMYNTSSEHWSTEKDADHYLRRDELLDGSGDVSLETSWSVGNPNEMQKKLGWIIADNEKNNVFAEKAFIYLNSQEKDAAYNDNDNRLTTAYESDYQNVWSKTADDIPDAWTQKGSYGIELADMKGVAYDDAKWDTFLNQMTWKELVKVCQDGGYGSDAMDSIGKPAMETHDGPGQLRRTAITAPDGNGYAWVCETVIGSTWNTELGKEQGTIEGNESIFLGVTGWYGPGANMHRNALSGRNFEYYSQDPIHSGNMLASVVGAFQKKGGTAYMKHGFMNDQETSRAGIVTFATEQAIREIYAKSYEIAIRKLDKANIGMMTSFNRIGLQSSVSYAINDQMYTKEWGYRGHTVTDAYNAGSGWDSEAMARGYAIPLNAAFVIFPPATALEGEWDSTLRGGNGGVKVATKAGDGLVESPTQYYFTRETAHRSLFTYANTNAITGLTSSNMLKSKTSFFMPDKTISDQVVYTASELASYKSAMDDLFGTSQYTTVVTGLPEGMSLNLNTGILSGTTPAQAGCYTYSITTKGEGKLSYISKTITGVINIAAPVFYDDHTSIDVKMPVTLNDENYHEYEGDKTAIPMSWASFGVAGDAKYAGKYVDVNYTATGLPNGLAMDPSTGKITGSMTNRMHAGDRIPVTVKMTAIRSTPVVFMPGYVFNQETYTTTVYLEYQSEAVGITNITSTTNDNGDTVVTITLSDGTTTTYVVPAGASGKDGTSGQKGVGIAGIKDNGNGTFTITLTDGSTTTFAATASNSGAWTVSIVAVSTAAVAVLGLLALTLSLVLKKKKQN